MYFCLPACHLIQNGRISNILKICHSEKGVSHLAVFGQGFLTLFSSKVLSKGNWAWSYGLQAWGKGQEETEERKMGRGGDGAGVEGQKWTEDCVTPA